MRKRAYGEKGVKVDSLSGRTALPQKTYPHFFLAVVILVIVFAALMGSRLILQAKDSLVVESVDTLSNTFGEASRNGGLPEYGEEGIDRYSSDLAASFYEEVAPTDTFVRSWASDDGHVVGLSSGLEDTDFFALLRSGLEKRGWLMVESGSDVMGSFMKKEGVYSWVFVQCVSQDDGSMAVVTLTEGP